jgi:hypothetical protein
MDYGKLDAGLSSAIEDDGGEGEESSLTVFVHTAGPPGKVAKAFLKKLGVRGIADGQQVFTADLSPRAVAELSEQEWVRHLRLSRKLRLLE